MNEPDDLIQETFERSFERLSRGRQAFSPKLVPREVGTLSSVSTGIAQVTGLPGIGYDEIVTFSNGTRGIAFNVDADVIGVVLLGDYTTLQAGAEVRRTGRVMDVAVGDGLLGRVIDPLGRPLDDRAPVVSSERKPVERPAASIMDRAPVTEPLQTGLKVVDALIPIGRGQRELILGDRQTGKTAIAVDAIINQKGTGVKCIYVAIGQKASSIDGCESRGDAKGPRCDGLYGCRGRRRERSAWACLCRSVRGNNHRGVLHGTRPRCADRL